MTQNLHLFKLLSGTLTLGLPRPAKPIGIVVSTVSSPGPGRLFVLLLWLLALTMLLGMLCALDTLLDLLLSLTI